MCVYVCMREKKTETETETEPSVSQKNKMSYSFLTVYSPPKEKEIIYVEVLWLLLL